MENLLAGKSRQSVLQAVKTLLDPILENWGSEDAFVQASVELLRKGLGDEEALSKDLETMAQQIYLTVMQIRSLQTRHIKSHQELTQTEKTLEPTFAQSPMRQGCLWLAVHARQEAIDRLDSPEGKTGQAKVIKALDRERANLSKRLQEAKYADLGQLEKALAGYAGKVLGKKNPFLLGTLAGDIIESARKRGRLPPNDTGLPVDFSDNSPETRLISTLEDIVRQAELSEARQRFSLLNDYQKGARYEALRKVMQKNIDDISPHAPGKFEGFCQAVESIAFPYPNPLEWVRVFLKPLYTNASQSTAFDKCRTEQSVNYRYQKIQEERGVNPIMLEMSKAFALATLKTVQQENLKNFLVDVNLVGEFDWPADIEDLKEHLSPEATP